MCSQVIFLFAVSKRGICKLEMTRTDRAESSSMQKRQEAGTLPPRLLGTLQRIHTWKGQQKEKLSKSQVSALHEKGNMPSATFDQSPSNPHMEAYLIP
ncbi:hypothetical protein FKM82_001064 [Ascaphus truei]